MIATRKTNDSNATNGRTDLNNIQGKDGDEDDTMQIY